MKKGEAKVQRFKGLKVQRFRGSELRSGEVRNE